MTTAPESVHLHASGRRKALPRNCLLVPTLSLSSLQCSRHTFLFSGYSNKPSVVVVVVFSSPEGLWHAIFFALNILCFLPFWWFTPVSLQFSAEIVYFYKKSSLSFSPYSPQTLTALSLIRPACPTVYFHWLWQIFCGTLAMNVIK